MQHHPVGVIGRGVFAIVKNMPPLREPKNEYFAFLAGLFGAFGNFFYLRTLRDFSVSLALNIGLTIVLPGVGFLPSLLFSAVYGFLRVRYSNEKLALLARSKDDDDVLPPGSGGELITLHPEQTEKPFSKAA